MICEKCKIREAAIQYTEVVNGIKKEHHFCAQCAQEMNFGQLSIFELDFPFSRILSALLTGEGENKESAYAQIVCPNCRTSYRDFVNKSRFGCPECYEIFDILVRDSIRQLQGSELHKGKIPKCRGHIPPKSLVQELPGGLDSEEKHQKDEDRHPSASLSDALRELRQKLKRAVREENYEMAAKYRDEIKALQEEGLPDA